MTDRYVCAELTWVWVNYPTVTLLKNDLGLCCMIETNSIYIFVMNWVVDFDPCRSVPTQRNLVDTSLLGVISRIMRHKMALGQGTHTH